MDRSDITEMITGITYINQMILKNGVQHHASNQTEKRVDNELVNRSLPTPQGRQKKRRNIRHINTCVKPSGKVDLNVSQTLFREYKHSGIYKLLYGNRGFVQLRVSMMSNESSQKL